MPDQRLIKALFIGDNHCDNLTPQSRMDNYMEATYEETRECLEIARKLGCDVVVFLGDLFNRMEVDGSCRNRIISLLQQDENGEPWPFDKYICVGNHDIKHNPAYLYRSALGSAILAGAIEHVEEAEKYKISFAHFTPDVEDRMRAGLLTTRDSLIWVAHASITTMPIYGDYLLFEDLPTHPNTRLVVAGHVHFPMEAEREDGTRFINPGNVGRNAATQENMNRAIKVLYCEYALDGSHLDTKYVRLKSPKPGAEVFRVEEIQARKEVEAETAQFVQQVSQFTAVSFAGDKFASVQKSAELKGLETDVLDIVLWAMREVHEKRAT